MKAGRVFAGLLFLMLASRAQAERIVSAETAVSEMKAYFPELRTNERDFALASIDKPSYQLPFVENFFTAPLTLGPQAENLAERVQLSSDSASLLEIGYDVVLGTQTAHETAKSVSVAPPYPNDWPAEFAPIFLKLYAAIAQAQLYVDASIDSVAPERRQGLLRLVDWPMKEGRKETFDREKRAWYEGMQSFDQASIGRAGVILAKAVDEALPQIIALSSPAVFQGFHGKPRRWITPLGVIALAGTDDDVYEGDRLDDVILLLDLGGRNVYKTAVAAAHEKQIRIVIDLGEGVEISGGQAGACNAGCGIFGVGMLYLPNHAGLKKIQIASHGAGCGVGGVGGLFLGGPAIVNSESFSQGAGAFGWGVLSAEGAADSSFTATLQGLGYGWTRGAGLFRLQGSSATLRCGLSQPDPRDPLGTSSLCLGTGQGERPFAAGGIGVAAVSGDDLKIDGSYFSFGSGYFHGLGVFRYRGDRSRLQARRYSLGTGVHGAFGHFSSAGDDNRILTWGVGPAYGWDHSVGSSLIQGERNVVQGDWGMGVASIGSRSYGYYNLRNSNLKLCEFGSANKTRDEPVYSLQIIKGDANRLQCQGTLPEPHGPFTKLTSPWGLYHFDNKVSFESNLGLTPVVWPALSREKEVERQKANLQAIMEDARAQPPTRRVAQWLDVASFSNLDKATPREAMKSLLALPEDRLPDFLDAYDSIGVSFDIMYQMAFAAHGEAAFRAVDLKMKSDPAAIQRFWWLLASTPVRLSIPMLRARIQSDAKMKRTPSYSSELASLVDLLNRGVDREPGRRGMLEALLSYAKTPTEKLKLDLAPILARVRITEAMTLLASATDAAPQLTQRLFEKSHLDIDMSTNLGESGASELLDIIREQRAGSLQLLQLETAALSQAAPPVRRALSRLLGSKDSDDLHRAIRALGKLHDPRDAPLLAPFLRHSNNVIQDAAATALSRMGEPGLPFLEKAQRSGSPQTRSAVIVALHDSTCRGAKNLFLRALNDDDPHVRRLAISMLSDLPDALKPDQNELVGSAKSRLGRETDPDVKLALSLL